MSKELEGKVALVTGAARNIGRAIALALADGGAAVVVNTRSSREEAHGVADEITKRGGKALVCLADVTDEAAYAGMVSQATERFGRLDMLVNNAAVRDVTAIDEIDLATFRRITAIILEGAFIGVKACLPHLRKSDAGAIVNIGGMSGHTGAAGRPRAHRDQARRGERTQDRPPARSAAAAARHVGGRGGRRSLPVRPGGAIHHRPGAARERGRLPALTLVPLALALASDWLTFTASAVTSGASGWNSSTG
jgi:NAD(P)-dependent dehydrogenase (short-subunit alcohol dehydrogenase family)